MYNLSLFDTAPTKRTSCKRLFDEIEPHLMLDEWISLIHPEYHPATFGRPPKDLSIMLRCFIVQNLRVLRRSHREFDLRKHHCAPICRHFDQRNGPPRRFDYLPVQEISL
jgi:hypothetical protein